MKYNELEVKILEWAKEKGILDKSYTINTSKKNRRGSQ